MNPILRNTLAFVVAFVIGTCVNIGLIQAGTSLIPPPAGVDVTNVDSLAANMHLFEPRHFMVPFAAHALGTLAGAFAVALMAVSQRKTLALTVAALFLVGGIWASVILPAPMWFKALDLVVAYLPMGWLGYTLRAGMGQRA